MLRTLQNHDPVNPVTQVIIEHLDFVIPSNL